MFGMFLYGKSDAQQITTNSDSVAAKMQWWDEAKFGMFIHWGVYSDLGGVWEGEPVEGYSEHIFRKKKYHWKGTKMKWRRILIQQSLMLRNG